MLLADKPLSADEFAALIGALGPFEPQPCVAVAVSGGADSLATALLVRDWVRGQGGIILAFVVDHGLRAESASEAVLTSQRLEAIGIAAHRITLHDLRRGPAMAARARDARHAALEAACAERGILHLVFGHHAGDQAETICMRLLAQSGPHGLAGMAALVETALVRRLRPLLSTSPERLRATLQAAGVQWVEDPSNRDPTQQRARLRALRAQNAAPDVATYALLRAAQARGMARAEDEQAVAAELAAVAGIYPQGFAIIAADTLSASALAALVALIGGRARPVASHRLTALAAGLRPATIGGVRITAAGRFGSGWLLVREAAAVAEPMPAQPGALWDGRFRLTASTPADAQIGAWGDDAPRKRGDQPAAALRALPVLRLDGAVISVNPAQMHEFTFSPACVAAPARFFPLPSV